MVKIKDAVMVDPEDPTRKWDIRIDEDGKFVKMVEQGNIVKKGRNNG